MAVLIGDTGANTLVGTRFDDTITGRAGEDMIFGGSGSDSLSGGADNDFLYANGLDVRPDELSLDTVSGGGGHDRLFVGNASGGEFDGGDGSDLLIFRQSDGPTIVNMVAGTAMFAGAAATFTGIEAVEGSSFADIILGGNSDARVWGGAGNDLIRGRAGDDVLWGDDRLNTAIGNDTIFGSFGEDSISGGKGADSLDGGVGADTLRGGEGQDTLVGGGAADVFQYSGPNGIDRVIGFTLGVDHIEIAGYGAALDSFTDLNIFNDASGNAVIRLNADVAGAGAIVLEGVARADLDANDFLFV